MESHEELLDVVLGLADADPGLTEDAKLLVLAALEGDDHLAAALDGTGGPPARPPARAAGEDGSADEPVGAFLTDIKVTGFRGIGETSTLKLVPGPGLTVVAGRNGSGKSSFAEALELALTGDSYRWATRSAVWSAEWRNLHHDATSQIRVRLTEEGQSKGMTVGVDWAPKADLADRKVWVQRHGQRREAGLTALGWGTAMDLFRPMLSYDELGGLLEAGPSRLHDALASILGLEQITDAQARLDAAVKRLGEPQQAAKAILDELRPVLNGLDDPRAAKALALLSKRRPDVDAIKALATGTAAQPVADLTGLRALAGLRVPAEAEVRQVVEALRTAVDELVATADTALDQAERRGGLLRQALEFHQQHGDGPCPVCGVGTLDNAWRTRVTANLAAEDAQLAQLRRAREQVAERRQTALGLVESVPEFAAPVRFDLAALADARAAWERWRRVPPEGAALAEHLAASYPDLATAVARLRDEAAAVLTGHEDAWAPVATRLAGWVGHTWQAQSRAATITVAKTARDWVKRNAQRMRNERLAPLADEARQIWADLRQESNVDLGAITLAGSGPRRSVHLAATVDGAETGALGVMSQGELHALALALFLPRATMEASPFRFVVLDDPIQAMDPAKVDGFVRVLTRLAADRQVIVLTHDDRLPQAVRYLRVPGARILDVYREANSHVQVGDAKDPAHRYLDDAFALAHDPDVPEDAQRRIVPGLCRMAVESAARDAFMARQFDTGAHRDDVEKTWQDATRTRQRVALAVPDGPDSLDRWATNQPWRRRTLRACGSENHGPLAGDLIAAIEDAKNLVADLRSGAR